MQRYQEFEAEVRQQTGDFKQWQHLLAAVPLSFRKRYVDALKAGWDMPSAFDIVMTSTHVNDDAFVQMLAQNPPGHT